MGESACLVRSFSNPADISCEAKEGDPVRALTESVSFGRFMSESLAWEKWSTFSHNRHLEEVEKFSKPGSVAQKKAYFEAYYKRRAAMKAAALLEQSNTAAVDASQAGTMITDSAANANTALDEQPVKDVSDADGVNTADACAGDLDVDIPDRGHELMDQDVNMVKITQVENSEALQDVNNHDMIIATPDKKFPNKECVDQQSSTSSRKRGTNSLSKSSTSSRPSKLPLHPSKRVASAQGRSVNGIAKSTGNSNDKKQKIPNSLHVSMNFVSGANKTPVRMPKDSSTPLQTPVRSSGKAADQENLAPSSERREPNSTSKLSNHGGVSKQATSKIRYNNPPTSKKSAADSNDQRRIVQKSLHMSINFAHRASETNKTSPKIDRDPATPLQTPTRAPINKGSRHPSKVLQPQDKRTRAVLNKSVSGGVTGDMRWPSSNCSNSSSASGRSTRSSISFSPFSFRSEERAAKRKEFFKKLEDKTNSKEAEKSLIQTRPKNPSTWPQSPKFGRKPASITVPDANSRPPRGPSINTESSKQALMKNNRIASSVTSLSRNRHENASPNIPHSVGKESNSKKHDRRGSVDGGCSN